MNRRSWWQQALWAGVLGVWVWGWSFPAVADPGKDVWVEAYINTTLAYTGQIFHYSLTAGIKNGTVRLPGAHVVWPGCRLIQYHEADVSDRHEGYRAVQGKYTLMALGLEEIHFPQLTAGFTWPEGTTVTAQTPALALKIASRHPQGLSLRDWRPPRGPAPVWYYAVLVLVLLGLGWLWLDWKHIRRKTERRRPAHLTAYAKLKSLGHSRAVIEGRVDRYFQELSRLLRQYLADRYNLSALETPREEILAVLKVRGVGSHARRLLNSILLQADLVKFAKTWAEFSEIAVAQRRAHLFVDHTRPAETKPKTGKKG
ncbi:MAG: hypothetical protein HGA76_02615 [Candidatus Firestonebacteria bacterium]|nr:hypothetical protein [Candidatus Firestonebacteria bacterium]